MLLTAHASTTRRHRLAPRAPASVNGREAELVAETLRSGTLGQGLMVARFEQELARQLGVDHVVAVANRATAMQVIARVAGWQRGHRILVSPFSCAAASYADRSSGADVTQVDVRDGLLTLDAETIADAIEADVVGVVAADTLGMPTDLSAIARVANARGVSLIVDASDALCAIRTSTGASRDDVDVTTILDFSAGRQLTTGVGGAICTNDAAMAELWREAVARDGSGIGDVAAAIGIAQLEKLPRMLAMSRMVADEYTRLLGDLRGIETPHADIGGNERSWSTYAISVRCALDIDHVIDAFAARDIVVGMALPLVDAHDLPVASSASQRAIALPFGPDLSPQHQRRVVDVLRDVLATA